MGVFAPPCEAQHVNVFMTAAYRRRSTSTDKQVGLPWVWGFPWVWVWDGYGDYDESPWVCGDSMGIFEWIPNYVETS